MEIIDIVRKLIGPIEPVGASHIDPGRLENLEAMAALVDDLIMDIHHVSKDKNRCEDSVMQCGKYADRYLASLQGELIEYGHGPAEED